MTQDWLLYTHHTSFTVRDLERSLRFYRDLLGFPVAREAEFQGEMISRITGLPGTQMKWALVKAGDHLLELIQYFSPAGTDFNASMRTSDIGSAHVCFHVRDLPELYRCWSAAGVRFVSEPVPLETGPNTGGFVVYLRDPDGYTLELLQRPRHLQGERQT